MPLQVTDLEVLLSLAWTMEVQIERFVCRQNIRNYRRRLETPSLRAPVFLPAGGPYFHDRSDRERTFSGPEARLGLGRIRFSVRWN